MLNYGYAYPQFILNFGHQIDIQMFQKKAALHKVKKQS